MGHKLRNASIVALTPLETIHLIDETLRQLDDRTLRDIGISRCQIETAVAGNFDLELVRIR